jgi:nickel-dependent lactate racemase
LCVVLVGRHIDDLPEARMVPLDIVDALEAPIGARKLEDLVAATDKVIVSVDDITRPTPAAAILPHVLQRVHAAGVGKEQVTLFMGMGTHRPMTEDELRIKLSDEIRGQYQAINRDYREGPFTDLGQTESGTPIEINHEILEADFRIAVGNIVPHISAGWGGGSKMILPGVCSRKTTDMMHLMACIIQPVLEVIGLTQRAINARSSGLRVCISITRAGIVLHRAFPNMRSEPALGSQVTS